MRYLANIIERFHDRFDFFVVTGNHHSPIDQDPLPGVIPETWMPQRGAEVYRFSREGLSRTEIARLVEEIDPDLVFLNSVFSTPSIRFLRERRKRGWKEISVIVSPCGELLETALKSKRLKKTAFLTAAKFGGLHDGVWWRASTEREGCEIKKVIGGDPLIHVSPDITTREILPEFSASMKPEKKPCSLRLVFLSRIVPNKNLHLVLRLLALIDSGNIELEIIGAAEDETYWSECQRLIENLPGNVKVDAVGSLQNEEVLQRLCDSHFFILPTEWENFGYVFIEALSAGCPLIISNRTDWSEIQTFGAGWCLPLENEESWLRTLENCVKMNNDGFQEMSAAARQYAVNWLAALEREKAASELFETALGPIESIKK